MNKKIIIVGVALIAVVLIAAGVAAALLSGGDSYATRLEDGYRYLQDGDFNSAILEFRMAMEEDPSREDAYYGLYQAYLHSGQSGLAATTLNLGITQTNSSRLQELLVQLQNNYLNPIVGEQIQSSQTNAVDNKDVVAILNTELLSLFGSANYGDYCVQYGNVHGTIEGTEYKRHIDAIGATLVYYNSSSDRVLDEGRGVPYNQFLPNEIRMDNVMSLFGGGSRITFDALKALSGVSDASISGSTVTFTCAGCEVTIICTESGVITSESENTIVPTGEGLEDEKEFVLVSTVTDATTGAPVSGAKVRLYEGYSTFGNCEEGTTDGAGRLNLEIVNSGTYTVVIEKEGYITETFEVYILSNMKETSKTFTISPTMSGDGIRFVLTWGASPTDLDSYLVGTASDGTYVNINFTNMRVTNAAGVEIALLDVDDVTSYGPETVTLYDTAGSYEFIVDDFTNSGNASTSGATVKIYVGDTLYTTVSIAGGIADQWHVCTVVDGVITVTNRAY